MTSATEHVCARCGKQLDPVNWWTAGVYDRFGGEKYKLCDTCAEQVTFAMQAVIKMDGEPDGFCAWAKRKEGGDGLDAS